MFEFIYSHANTQSIPINKDYQHVEQVGSDLCRLKNDLKSMMAICDLNRKFPR